MKPEWKDITSYSRDGDKTPHWWELRTGPIKIAVGNDHIHYSFKETQGKIWLLNAEGFSDTHILKASNEQDAKAEAILLVLNRAREIMTTLEAL